VELNYKSTTYKDTHLDDDLEVQPTKLVEFPRGENLQTLFPQRWKILLWTVSFWECARTKDCWPL